MQQSTGSMHIAYSTAGGDPRQYEYEDRWKLKAVEIIQSLAQPGNKLRVLDFGCGRGELLQLLAERGFECVGVDADPNCVALGGRFAPCYQATVDTLHQILANEQFDVVTCLHVLEHLENPTEAVRKLAALSRRWLIIAVPNLSTPERLQWRKKRLRPCNAGHRQGWDASHLKVFLENHCGLHIERWVPDTVVAGCTKLSRLLGWLGLRRLIEYRLLPKLFPFWSLSLIVLCEKPTPAAPSPAKP